MNGGVGHEERMRKEKKGAMLYQKPVSHTSIRPLGYKAWWGSMDLVTLARSDFCLTCEKGIYVESFSLGLDYEGMMIRC